MPCNYKLGAHSLGSVPLWVIIYSLKWVTVYKKRTSYRKCYRTRSYDLRSSVPTCVLLPSSFSPTEHTHSLWTPKLQFSDPPKQSDLLVLEMLGFEILSDLRESRGASATSKHYKIIFEHNSVKYVVVQKSFTSMWWKTELCNSYVACDVLNGHIQ